MPVKQATKVRGCQNRIGAAVLTQLFYGVSLLAMNPLDVQYLSDVLQLPRPRLTELLSVSVRSSYAKNELIQPPRNVFGRLGYILNGAVRTYHVTDNGQEISYLLQVNGDFIGDYESYLSGRRSSFTLETVLPTEVLFFERASIERLMEQDVFWVHFAKRVSDLVFLDAKKRLDDLLFLTPEARYKKLIEKSPAIFSKIPQKYISTYLGVQPQSLSRIRRRIYKKSNS